MIRNEGKVSLETKGTIKESSEGSPPTVGLD
jgi:hypothetical protein